MDSYREVSRADRRMETFCETFLKRGPMDFVTYQIAIKTCKTKMLVILGAVGSWLSIGWLIFADFACLCYPRR